MPSPAQTAPIAIASPSPSPIATVDPRLSAAIDLIHALGGEASLADQWSYVPSLRACEGLDTGGELYNGSRNGTCAWNGTWRVSWGLDGTLIDLRNTPTANPDATPVPKLTLAQAKARVAQLTTILGITMGTPGRFGEDDLGWQANWDRNIDGVPAVSDGFSDGITLALYDDGTFREYVYQWSPVASKPTRILTKAEAVAAIAPSHCPLTGKNACAMSLEWYRSGVAPANEPMRLTWTISSPDLLFVIDAGTGELLDVGIPCSLKTAPGSLPRGHSRPR